MESEGVLAGTRIVDATVGHAGPVATRWLAEQGADVLKLEPGGGDPLRTDHPAAFASWNRSKRTSRLDITDHANQRTLHDLLAVADVFVHGLTSGAAADLGLSVTDLGLRHPHLLVATVTAYPLGHPDEERVGNELLVQARVGTMDEQEALRDGPMYIRMPVANWGAAFLLAGGIVTRLLERERTGAIRSIHTSLMQGLLAPSALFWQRAGDAPTWMTDHTLPKLNEPPHIAMFECADGRWLQMMGGFTKSEPLRDVLAEMGRSAMFGQRVTWATREPWAEVFATRTSDEWTALLWPADALCMPILHVGEVFSTEQAVANGYVVPVVDPEFGATLQAGSAFDVGELLVGSGPSAEGEGLTASPWTPRPPRDQQDGADADRLPLSGVRVLDFGSFVAGPFGSQCLADFGADVVKIEPIRGEKGREINQYTGCQRGKRVIAVDLRHPRAGEILQPLLASADVVMHNMRMSAAAKMGIDEVSVRKANPRAVFAHTSAYGATGPWHALPGFDPTGFALSGWAHGISGDGQRPSWLRMSAMDCMTGLANFVAVALALYDRERHGRSLSTATSLMATAVTFASETLLDGDGEIAPCPPVTPDQTGLGPWERIHQARDGWVAIWARDDRERQALAAALAATPADDGSDVAATIASMDASDVAERLEAAGIPVEIVNLDHRDAMFDRELTIGSGLVRRVEGSAYGWFENPGGFWSQADGTPLRNDGPIAAVGAHTVAVLLEAGLSPALVADLHANAVVGGPTAELELTADAIGA